MHLPMSTKMAEGAQPLRCRQHACVDMSRPLPLDMNTSVGQSGTKSGWGGSPNGIGFTELGFRRESVQPALFDAAERGLGRIQPPIFAQFRALRGRTWPHFPIRASGSFFGHPSSTSLGASIELSPSTYPTTTVNLIQAAEPETLEQTMPGNGAPKSAH